ncbi:MAG: hypothetical protein E6K82_25800 [Candidatus Rokuibacteriota bacterium]|nr:MAG: hypothetical protein E6K82_25800 [Candidatus Rokubacteria bacterium]
MHRRRHGRRRALRGRLSALAVLLAVVLAALLPLAYASPPDPTWFGGLWDDDDYDDVVVAAVQAVACVDNLAAFEPKRFR